MKGIHYLFYFLPYIFILLIIFMTNNIISIRQKEGRLNKYGIISGIVIIISLTIYYLPTTSILKGYTLNFMSITVVNNQKNVSITDKEKVDKLVSIVNSHTFIRSSVRTIKQQNFADSLFIMIGTQNEQPWRLIQLYVLKDNIKNNAIEINDKMYNVRDKAGLSKDILGILDEFGVLEN